MAAVKETVKKTTRTAKAAKSAEASIEVADNKELSEVKPEPKKRGRKPAVKKAELTANISVQFAGKSYSTEELVKIAKDVWQYDYKREEKDLLSVELYVKPEESAVYYVFNGTEDGKFGI